MSDRNPLKPLVRHSHGTVYVPRCKECGVLDTLVWVNRETETLRCMECGAFVGYEKLVWDRTGE